MIVQTQTTSFKAELYQAIHDLTTDTLKLALYTAEANLDAATTAYTTANEITAVVLVHNYLPGILKRERRFIDNGGRFIVPLPTPVVL